MSKQMPAFNRGSDTSFAAAKSVQGDIAEQQRRLVYTTIRKSGVDGMTTDDVEAKTGLIHQSASARVNELMTDGRIVDSGRRRKTRSNRKAAVMVATVVEHKEKKAMAKKKNSRVQAEVERDEDEDDDDDDEETGDGDEGGDTTAEPSLTSKCAKVQSRMVGLLERTLGDDEEGKRRVLRSTAALLGIEIT